VSEDLVPPDSTKAAYGFAGLSTLVSAVDFEALEIESRAKEAPASDPTIRALRFASFDKALFSGWRTTLLRIAIMLAVPPAAAMCAWLLTSVMSGTSPSNRADNAAPDDCLHAAHVSASGDAPPCGKSPAGHPEK
jgi:hypothetical protein